MWTFDWVWLLTTGAYLFPVALGTLLADLKYPVIVPVLSHGCRCLHLCQAERGLMADFSGILDFLMACSSVC